MEDAEKRAVLQEIVEMTAPPRMQPGDITIADYMEATGLKGNTARRYLMRLANEGVLTTELVLLRGRYVRVFRKAAE